MITFIFILICSFYGIGLLTAIASQLIYKITKQEQYKVTFDLAASIILFGFISFLLFCCQITGDIFIKLTSRIESIKDKEIF